MRVKVLYNTKTLTFGEVYTVISHKVDRFKNMFGEWKNRDKYLIVGDDGNEHWYSSSRFEEV